MHVHNIDLVINGGLTEGEGPRLILIRSTLNHVGCILSGILEMLFHPHQTAVEGKWAPL